MALAASHHARGAVPRALLRAIVVGELGDVLGQRATGNVSQRGLLQHRPHTGAQRAPNVGQRGSGARVGQVAKSDIADTSQRSVDAAQYVGDADLGARTRQFITTLATAVASHQAVGAQVGQDIDEKLRWYALGRSQIVGLDHGATGGRGELDHRPHRVLRLS